MEILYNREFVHGLSWALSAIFGGWALCQSVLHCITSQKTVILIFAAVKIFTFKTKKELPKHLITHVYRQEGWNSPCSIFNWIWEASCMVPTSTREFLNFSKYSIWTATFLMKIRVLWYVTVSVGKQFGMFWMTVVPSTMSHDLYLQPHLYDLRPYICNAYIW